MNEKDPIFRSLAMIEEKIREKLTVEMLAEGAHFSKYHYQRKFREAVGDTVMGYVTRRKLFWAAQELARSQDSVLAIALKYGYDSHEGFTRSFRAYWGVTPTEYRKYHSFIGFPAKKGECAMANPKNMGEMVRELNRLMVQAKEVMENTKKYQGVGANAAAFYAQVWEFASKRMGAMAERLRELLERIPVAAEHPDELPVCFLIVKSMEGAAFEASVTAFQAGLMIARAMPEQRTAFRPLCEQYEHLARNAREASKKAVDFFYELSMSVFQDMRKDAGERIQNAIIAGKMAAEKLAVPTLPYGYIADGIRNLAEELEALPFEEVTVSFLEDAIFRLETILFAADMDILRAPQHRQLFDGVSDFKEQLLWTAEFFKSLSADTARAFAAWESKSAGCITETRYRELAAQEELLLFYLKGEIQKLGDAHLDEGQKKALGAVCGKMDKAVRMARHTKGGEENREITELLLHAYDDLLAQANQLGMCAGAVRYLAEEIKKSCIYFTENKEKAVQ